jgi:GT2 family glycosyltransferase
MWKRPRVEVVTDCLPTVAVVIVTRNRGQDALAAMRSALIQQGIRLEILVYDDASEDGSTDILESVTDPAIRLFCAKHRKGYIHWRNRGFADAESEFVFSLDDDAFFSSPYTLKENAALLAESNQAFAVSVPFVEPRSGYPGRDLHSLQPGQQVRNYIGCSHLVRRSVVVATGGYREFLVHQTEERDLCLRLLSCGYTVIYGVGMPVVHLVSPRRDSDRLTYYGYRNTLLVTGLNAPLWIAIPRMILDTFRLLRYRFECRSLGLKLRGILAGWAGTVIHWSKRTPVSADCFQTFLRLPLAGPIACDVSAFPESNTNAMSRAADPC